MSDATNNIPSPASLEKFLENQNRELAIKEKEIDLEREKNIAAQRTDERQFEFAREQRENNLPQSKETARMTDSTGRQSKRKASP